MSTTPTSLISTSTTFALNDRDVRPGGTFVVGSEKEASWEESHRGVLIEGVNLFSPLFPAKNPQVGLGIGNI